MKKNNMAKRLIGFAGVFAGIMIAAILLPSLVVAVTGGSAEEAALRAVSKVVSETNDTALASKLLDAVLDLSKVVDALGGTIRGTADNVASNFIEIGMITADNDAIEKCGTIIGKIPTTTTTQAETLKIEDYVDILKARIWITGTVSSTFSVAMGTTTAGYVAFNASSSNAGFPDGIIERSIFATTSVNVTYNPGYRSVHFSSSTQFSGRTEYGFRVNSSTPITIFKQNVSDVTQGTFETGICGSAGVQCEAVTSTAIGATVNYAIDYCYVDANS